MSFEFEKGESVSDEIRRLVVNRIDSAITGLRTEGDAVHEGIHDARKRFKQIRAVLRLARDELGDRYPFENAWFRDHGRSLSAARDAQALVEALDKLVPPRRKSPGVDKVRAALAARRDALAAAELQEAGALAEIVAELEAGKARVAAWPLGKDGFSGIRPGLRQVYSRGRRAMKRAYRVSSDEAFHEWRKQVKYHWYHTRLLAPTWAAALDSRAAELKRLADCLGDDHDLVVLRDTLTAEPDHYGGAAGVDDLLGLAKTRQQRLRAQAQGLGKRLYAESGKDFANRMSIYWTAWKS